MREFTDTEAASIYEANVCPFCATGVAQFILGPRGGMSQNVECPTCAARFNMIAREFWQRWPEARFGQVLAESRPVPPDYKPRACPGCGRIMSRREDNEQGVCNDCAVHPRGE